MNLNREFESAEQEFKQILEDFFASVYHEKYLGSHGLDHHRRVWKNARELTSLLSENNLLADGFSVRSLIISCYLHDIGMAIDPGIRHGHYSRSLCLEFFNSQGINKSDYEEVLEAIENHDRKEYNILSSRYDLLTILSAADDLDAFGYIGIYRYCEIYLAREISLPELGNRILENAERRFEAFSSLFSFSDKLINAQRTRFAILGNFFIDYNIKVTGYFFGSNESSGTCGIVDILKQMVTNKENIRELFYHSQESWHDPVIVSFFRELSAELSL
jgi:HD superfamily phosphodiesterase